MYTSHIIVTNFAYFFNDLKMRMKTGNGTLPAYDAVIFDEAIFKRSAFSELDHGNQVELAQLRQTFHQQIDEVYAQVGKKMRDDQGGLLAFKLMTTKIEISEVCATLSQAQQFL
ncbi:hypothetical protein PODO_19660 [Paenibacillus odorifer]|nr:hypothetical protein PODO_19660 [Paenibacillus odorifer]